MVVVICSCWYNTHKIEVNISIRGGNREQGVNLNVARSVCGCLSVWVISHWRRHKNVGWHVIVIVVRLNIIGYTRATGQHLGWPELNWIELANLLADWRHSHWRRLGHCLESTRKQRVVIAKLNISLDLNAINFLDSLSVFLGPGNKPKTNQTNPKPFEPKNLMSVTTEKRLNERTPECEYSFFVAYCTWTVHCIRYSFIRLICLGIRPSILCQFRFVNVALFMQ